MLQKDNARLVEFPFTFIPGEKDAQSLNVSSDDN